MHDYRMMTAGAVQPESAAVVSASAARVCSSVPDVAAVHWSRVLTISRGLARAAGRTRSDYARVLLGAVHFRCERARCTGLCRRPSRPAKLVHGWLARKASLRVPRPQQSVASFFLERRRCSYHPPPPPPDSACCVCGSLAVSWYVRRDTAATAQPRSAKTRTRSPDCGAAHRTPSRSGDTGQHSQSPLLATVPLIREMHGMPLRSAMSPAPLATMAVTARRSKAKTWSGE